MIYSVIGVFPSNSGAFQWSVMLSSVTSSSSGIPGVLGTSEKIEPKFDVNDKVAIPIFE